MKRVILILGAVLCLLGGQARAEDAPAELPPELRQAVPEPAEPLLLSLFRQLLTALHKLICSAAEQNSGTEP